MEEHRLENPSNARIFINYNAKDKVRFEYPCKKSSKKSVKSTLFSALTSGYGLIVILIIVGIVITANYTENIKIKTIGLSIGLIFFTLPLTLYHILSRSKWFIKNIPEINKFLLSEYYYKKITKLDKLEYEIEYFDNIFLDYKAKGEFGRYLERIEITEYPFDIIVKNFLRKKLKQKQDFIWKAKFYFKEIPKTGYLEINYY